MTPSSNAAKAGTRLTTTYPEGAAWVTGECAMLTTSPPTLTASVSLLLRRNFSRWKDSPPAPAAFVSDDRRQTAAAGGQAVPRNAGDTLLGLHDGVLKAGSGRSTPTELTEGQEGVIYNGEQMWGSISPSSSLPFCQIRLPLDSGDPHLATHRHPLQPLSRAPDRLDSQWHQSPSSTRTPPSAMTSTLAT